ncbi:hypothetical protein MKX01_004579 [Papaver californicum]|nr:hypothetical protein MKX01_004579 [Papaver californicum]
MHYHQPFSSYISFFFFLFVILIFPSIPATNVKAVFYIMSPGCGVPDNDDHKLHTTKHYSFFNGRHTWDHSTVMLKYALTLRHIIDYIKVYSYIRVVLERAFSRWSSVIPFNFIETQDYEHVNITIGFYYSDHGDRYPFDNKVLAHAGGPKSGTLHFNVAFTWAVDFNSEKSADDLESIAIHENGHVLGLGHSSIHGAVMWGYASHPHCIILKFLL